MPEAQLIRHGLWERFAEFMLNEYEVEDGKMPLRHDEPKRLACSVVINYLRIMLNLVADKWKAIGSNAAKLFCTCLDPHATTEAAKWLGGIKKKIIRICFERDKINGELTDKSETPIYLPEVKKMVAGRAILRRPAGPWRSRRHGTPAGARARPRGSPSTAWSGTRSSGRSASPARSRRHRRSSSSCRKRGGESGGCARVADDGNKYRARDKAPCENTHRGNGIRSAS